MPELPEVETVVRGLNQYLVGHVIASFKNDWAKTIKTPLVIFKKEIEGSKVVSVERRGKLIIINLESPSKNSKQNHSLLIHLKMTGQIVYKSNNLSYGAGHPNDSLISKLPDSTTRITFDLDNDSQLYFNDVRKFGWVEIVPTIDKNAHRFLASMGPEPLVMATPDFIQLFKKYPNSQIKAKLLDQKIIAGVGNIYADEALWATRIHPQSKIQNVSDNQLAELFKNLKKILLLSIEQGGSSSANYIKVDGKTGSYLNFANVYKKEGQPCKHCGETIIRTIAAGRGTRICPSCQTGEYS